MKNKIIGRIVTHGPASRTIKGRELRAFIRVQKRSQAFLALQEAYRA